MNDGPGDLRTAFDRLEQLLEFPVDFPLKVMGKRVDGFAQAIVDLTLRHVPGFDASTIGLRVSTKGNWLSLTLVVRIDSRDQLEALYRELSSHPMVRIVL